MAGVNKVILIGHLTKDPELKYGQQSGKAVCRFGLAVNDRKDADAEFFNIVCFDRIAEVANEYLSKGRPVYIEGRRQTNKWQDKDGQPRSSVEIQASSLTMLGGGKSTESGPDASRRNDQAQAQTRTRADKNKTLYSDENDFGPAPPMDDMPF